MQKILNLLNSSQVVYWSEVLDFKQGYNFSYIKAKAGIVDNTYLYIRSLLCKII